MKNVKILALAATLALGFALSAQAQTDNTTGSDQYSTQPAQTTPATTTDSNSMSNTGTASDPASATQSTQMDSGKTNSQPQDDYTKRDDYSKNPYWTPQQWDYINNSITN